MNTKDVDVIMHAGKQISEAFSQDSLIWAEYGWLNPRHTVRFQVTIPSNVGGSITIYIYKW